MGQCAWNPGVRAPRGRGGHCRRCIGCHRGWWSTARNQDPHERPPRNLHCRDAEAKVRTSCLPHRISASFWSRKVDPWPGLGGSSRQAERAPRAQGACRSLLATGLHSAYPTAHLYLPPSSWLSCPPHRNPSLRVGHSCRPRGDRAESRPEELRLVGAQASRGEGGTPRPGAW